MTSQPEIRDDDVVLTDIRDAHRFDVAALTAYLEAEVPEMKAPFEIRQFEGGQSNPTFLLTGADGVRYVLRKQPPGELLPSAHRVDREFRVMSGLAKTEVPVPEMLHLCKETEIIGTMFFVMRHVDGRMHADPLLKALPREERIQVYDHFIEVLAKLHTVDLAAAGLETYGRPSNYFGRQVDIWSKQYVASKTGDIAAMDALMEWLPENLPEDEAPAIVHGDFRLANMILHPTEPRIVAVLDWELSTLGQPLADVSYCCLGFNGKLIEPNFSGVDLAAEGLPDEAHFLAHYCRHAGRPPVENWPFYLAFSGFRSAAIIQGVYKRGLDGIASSEGTERFADKCRSRAEAAWALVGG
ncbi:MAG: phosphotransferase [Rhodospirillales bacterium]|jgi:aminoglycoside phosphotransferase (APT) family kinase protein|nr:phosphotransferase family protein [Rhodospirillaceae bacterium]MDP6430115.1 phosphotransferase [Rhodospirillales bacterium]MDP6645815.1 phosphotransferase [Rhodospirillales bacterium]MDP6842380.1 phosphotransferase [Rhodospirillales bacterium]